MTQVDTLDHEVEENPAGLTFVCLAVLLILWGAVGSMVLSPMALFLPVVVPISFWAAWNDMAHMKIPNHAVSALLLSFAILGLFAFPSTDYMWRWSHFAVLIVIGFLANMFRLIGAGDAKFLAAMGPLMNLDDVNGIVRLFAATLLAAFAAHRMMRAIPALRNLVAEWDSWERRDFPMGLALGGALLIYTGILVFQGR